MARLKFLYRHKQSLDLKTRILLCKSLILCHFDYSISAWYMPLNQQLKKSLQVMQNKIVRFILDLGPRSHIGQSELDKVGLLNVNDRARQLIIHHMYNIFKETAPRYLCEKFVPNTSTYNTRWSENCFIVPHAKGLTSGNFDIIGVKEWNRLSPNIKKCNSKPSFKKKVKQLLKKEAHEKESSLYV